MIRPQSHHTRFDAACTKCNQEDSNKWYGPDKKTKTILVFRKLWMLFSLHVWKTFYSFLSIAHSPEWQRSLTKGVQYSHPQNCSVFPYKWVRHHGSDQTRGVAAKLVNMVEYCTDVFCFLLSRRNERYKMYALYKFSHRLSRFSWTNESNKLSKLLKKNKVKRMQLVWTKFYHSCHSRRTFHRPPWR